MRILGIVSYNGKEFQGWQKQKNGERTVEEEIEKVLSQYFNNDITIYGAGRTDSGVHAANQSFHFDVNVDSIDIDRALCSLNQMLPPDIKIMDLEQVETDFHARYNAKYKHYSYIVCLSDKEVFFTDTMYVCPFKLDIDLMKKAITYFKGTHNFKNFTSKPEDEQNFVRNIVEANIFTDGKMINFDFVGNGFMRYQIRMMVGTLIEIGRGKFKANELQALIDSEGDRQIVSYKAPAEGLTLVDVIY